MARITLADLITAEVATASVPKTQTQIAGTPLPVFRVTTAMADATPAGVELYDRTFNGTVDSAVVFGINRGDGGLVVAGKPGAGFVVEGDYNDGTKRVMEMYGEFMGSDGSTFRRWFAAQFNRATNDLTAVVINAAANGLVDFQDQANTRNYGGIGYGGSTDQSLLRLGFGATNNAFVAQTISATETDILINNHRRFYLFDAFGVGGALSINVVDNEQSLTVQSYDNAQGVLKLTGLAGQTADVATIYKNTTMKHRFNKDGYSITKCAAAPADGDLSASELTWWIDATNGACKFMVKAKQADGTVRTGSLALT